MVAAQKMDFDTWLARRVKVPGASIDATKELAIKRYFPDGLTPEASGAIVLAHSANGSTAVSPASPRFATPAVPEHNQLKHLLETAMGK